MREFCTPGSVRGQSGNWLSYLDPLYDAVHGKGEHTGHRVSTMGHGIGLQKSRPGFIPLVGFQGDLFPQEGTRLGRSSAAFFILDPDRF